MCNREYINVRNSSGDVLDCPNCSYGDVPKNRDVIISVETTVVEEPTPSVAVTK